jgi:hypothetical protein
MLNSRRDMVLASLALALAPEEAFTQEGKPAAGTGPARPANPAPGTDLSGNWIFNRQIRTRSGDIRTQVLTMTLRQEGNKLTGDASFTTINVNQEGRFPVHGWIEGDQIGISAWVDWEGGEAISMRLALQTGQLVGTKRSTHDAPHKWDKDDTVAITYSRQ